MESDPILDEELEGFEDRLGRNGVDLSMFQSQASIDEIESAFAGFPHFCLPPGVASFYRWHNGYSPRLFPMTTGALYYPSVSQAHSELMDEGTQLYEMLDYWSVDNDDPYSITNMMPLWPLFTGENAPMVVVSPGCYDEGAVYRVSFGATVAIEEEVRVGSLLDLVRLWNSLIDAGRYEFKPYKDGRGTYCVPTAEWKIEANSLRDQPGNRQLWLY